MMTDSQSSLIRGPVSLALQDARGEAVSIADIMFSCVSAQQPCGLSSPSSRDGPSLKVSADGGIFYFLMAIRYNIFLFSRLFRLLYRK